MSESQSRYGIMEDLNKQKLEARSKLANIQQEEKQSEINYNNTIISLNNQISMENLNYKDIHKNWKVNKNLEIAMKENEFKSVIEKMKQDIVKKDSTYESDHLKKISSLMEQVQMTKESFKNFNEMKGMSAKNIELQITELDKAITSLKEMSKEQPK